MKTETIELFRGPTAGLTYKVGYEYLDGELILFLRITEGAEDMDGLFSKSPDIDNMNQEE